MVENDGKTNKPAPLAPSGQPAPAPQGKPVDTEFLRKGAGVGPGPVRTVFVRDHEEPRSRPLTEGKDPEK